MKNISFARLALSAAIAMVFAGGALAQSGVNRNEFFGGYSHSRVDTGLESEDLGSEFNSSFGKYVGANGVNLQYTRNFSKFVGAKFDFAANAANEEVNFDGDQFDLKYRSQSYMGGIQVKNNSKEAGRLKPFAHVLAGVARQTVKIQSPVLAEDFPNSEIKLVQNNFTFAVGGGLDIKASKRVDIRVFQFDYNPTFLRGADFDEFETDSKLQNNFRFGFGIVIH